MVELFAAAMAGAELGIDAAPFSGTAGGPPRTGQFFIAIDPGVTSDGRFSGQLSRLVAAICAQEGTRLPGAKRKAARARALREGVDVPQDLLVRISAIAPQ